MMRIERPLPFICVVVAFNSNGRDAAVMVDSNVKGNERWTWRVGGKLSGKMKKSCQVQMSMKFT